jgi:hypothetical protein
MSTAPRGQPVTTLHAFAREWRRLLLQASPLYWTLQAAIALGAVALMLLLTVVSPGSDGPAAQGLLLRVALDALLLFLLSHLALRPALRLYFVGHSRRGRDWAALLLLVLMLAGLAQVLAEVIERHSALPSPISALRLEAGHSQIDLVLGEHARLLELVNRTAAFGLWALLYVALSALRNRRRLKRQLRAARLAQLTHQLSPHFLFNAFNTIRGMIFEDRERAAELITQLSELFRFHLDHEARAEQTLAEEWQLAQRYLDLEAVRLDARLQLQVELAEDCLPRALPCLTVLGLVENAIKHGIAPNVGGGRLWLRAWSAADGWSLEVGNSTGSGRADHGSATGLANLEERLQLSFGGRARLRREQRDDSFRVLIELPA